MGLKGQCWQKNMSVNIFYERMILKVKDKKIISKNKVFKEKVECCELQKLSF